jgi:ribonuclease BN (tRNA processing enzyme)
MSEMPTTLRFIGTGSCIPEVGGETVCCLLNDTVMVDAGWCAALHMRRFGCDPLDLTHLFITHCHHDHFLGLAPLIFYRGMRAADRGGPLTIVGPRTEVGIAVERALGYLQTDRYDDVAEPVTVLPLRPGDNCLAGGFRVSSAQVVHPALSLAYRFGDSETGASIVIAGDTSYYEPLHRFAAGADVFVHEASYGPASVDPLKPWGHCGAPDAARLALAAGVKRLYLVHFPASKAAETLAAAREIFPDTYLPEEGELLELPL